MKGAQYFSHDANARNDEKIVALRMNHGWEGYGVYWAIIEKLRESGNYRLSTNFNLLAFDLRTTNELVKSIVSGFGLFTIEDDQFYSQSLCNRMSIKDEASEKARVKALKRWGRNDSDAAPDAGADAAAMQQQSSSCASKERKESKGKKEGDTRAPDASQVQPPRPLANDPDPSNYSRPRSAPDYQAVHECFYRLGKPDEAKGFFDYYEGLNWHKGNTPIINWQAFANRWVTGDKPSKSSAEPAQTINKKLL